MSINEKLEQLKQEAREAAAAGDLNAQWKYANYMMSPTSTLEQYKEGLMFLILAASRGHCLAQIDLAYDYFYGKGCKKDVDDALVLCEQALSTFQEVIWEKKEKEKNTDLSFWLINQQKAVRLRDTILKLKSIPKPVSDSQLALFQAFDGHDWSKLESMLAENVTFSFMFKPPLEGKKAVLEWFEGRFSDREYQVSLVPTVRFGMVVEIHIPNDMHNLIRSLFFTRTNEEGRIDRIAHQAYNGGDFCFTTGNEPFLWQEIAPCLNDLDTARHPASALVRGRMFCMGCGKLSHELRWIRFHSNPALHDGFTYIGTMSVCTDCQQQVEFYLKECKVG